MGAVSSDLGFFLWDEHPRWGWAPRVGDLFSEVTGSTVLKLSGLVWLAWSDSDFLKVYLRIPTPGSPTPGSPTPGRFSLTNGFSSILGDRIALKPGGWMWFHPFFLWGSDPRDGAPRDPVGPTPGGITILINRKVAYRYVVLQFSGWVWFHPN